MAATDITTYLWFDEQSLEAAEFYVGLFPGAKLGSIQTGAPKSVAGLVEYRGEGR